MRRRRRRRKWKSERSMPEVCSPESVVTFKRQIEMLTVLVEEVKHNRFDFLCEFDTLPRENLV